MIADTTQLLERLDAIGRSLSSSPYALALIGLGSVGLELDRLDAYSDLDFFAIVKEGHKATFVNNIDWLSRAAPVAYSFRNTADGRKLLYADGIFCEYAVFTPSELVEAVYPPGRLVWARDDFDATLAAPRRRPPAPAPPDVDWLLGEAQTNLYVGLGRYRRGEKLSAFRFIQGYAVDRMVELSALIGDGGGAVAVDPFDRARRYEQRYPDAAAVLPQVMQGYERTPESAAALLAWLDAHFDINPVLKQAIEELLT